MLRSVLIYVAVMAAGVLPLKALAGELDPPGTPFDPISAMYSLEDIYNRLVDGLAGEKRTGAFTEPASDPQTATGHTLDDIMAIAPAADNTAGAAPNDVAAEKLYWGLRTDGSGWGLQTGMRTTATLSADSNTLAADYYEATAFDAIDADLAPANIKSGIDIFGIGGTVLEADGDADTRHVLSGRTYSRAGAVGLTGTMIDRGAVSIPPGTADQTIAQGYHNGSGIVQGDADLLAANIKSGVDIFGIGGTVLEADGDADPGHVLSGRTYSRSGAVGLTGTMVDRGAVSIPPGTADQTIVQGYHNGLGIVQGDADLLAANIKSGVDIFGIGGTVLEADGDADPGHVLSGRTYSRSGAVGLTGTMVDRGAVTIPPGTADQTIAQGYHNGSGIVQGDVDLLAANIKEGTAIFGVTGTYNGVTCDGTLSPGGRWCDNGDGTVTDMPTGAIWLKNAGCLAHEDWDSAIFLIIETLRTGECGLTDGSALGDWRLPTIEELHGLALGSETVRMDNPHLFTGVQDQNYWSISSLNAVQAWTESMVFGFSINADKKPAVPIPAHRIWPVRAGN